MKKIFKTSFLLVITLFVMTNCSKQKKFERAFTGTWNIDAYQVYEEDTDITGTFTFSKKKSDAVAAITNTGELYEGKIVYSNGTEVDFTYEYFDILSHNDVAVVLHGADGSGYKTLITEMLTKKIWIFYFLDQYGYVISEKYYLSK